MTNRIALSNSHWPRASERGDEALGGTVRLLTLTWPSADGGGFSRDEQLAWLDSAQARRLSLVVIAGERTVELYSTERDRARAFRPVIEALRARVEAAPSLGTARVVERSGVDAARHLLKRAGGLGFDVLGDRHFAIELNAAAATASFAATLGPSLASLFRAAANTSRRVRQETALGSPSASNAMRELELLATERIVEEELLAWQAQEAEVFRAAEEARVYREIEEQNQQAALASPGLEGLEQTEVARRTGRNSLFGEEPASAVRLRVSERFSVIPFNEKLGS